MNIENTSVNKRVYNFESSASRKRRAHFKASSEAQRQNKSKIENMLNNINFYLNSIGLEFSNDIFHVKERRSDNSTVNPRVVFYCNNEPVNKKILSSVAVSTDREVLETKRNFDKELTYQVLKAKDKASLSRKQLLIFVDLFENPNKKKITNFMIEKFANKMDRLFELKKLEHPLIKLGYY
jgi:hypothetical protein